VESVRDEKQSRQFSAGNLMLEEVILLREKERNFIRMKLFLKLQIPL
jgi:hypothetical protein